jgi:hypothetical protein
VFEAMKKLSLGESGFERKTEHTRKREFLDEMNLWQVPWGELVLLIAPYTPSLEPKAVAHRMQLRQC